MEDHDFLSKIHEVAGCANSSDQPNAYLVDVGYDTVLVAKFDMDEDEEVLINYSFWNTAMSGPGFTATKKNKSYFGHIIGAYGDSSLVIATFFSKKN